MKYTQEEALQYIQENDVKFIRLAFCDLNGIQKNLSVMPCELERAFRQGISFDASNIAGFGGVNEGSLYLRPDPSTLALLPWRPMQGRVVRFFCDIIRADGQPYSCDSRALLKETLRQLRSMGIVCRVGIKSEFYLFNLDEHGMPTREPLDRAGYMDVAPLDRGENVRRDICLTLEEMGMRPESSHHEHGPGQNEIDFHYSIALEAADNFVTFKWAVKTISARNGAYASFMPKPLEGESGNGMHISLFLFRDDVNLFDAGQAGDDKTAQYFVNGVLRHAEEITAALNSTINSYSRLAAENCRNIGTDTEKGRIIRLAETRGEFAGMELRSPDAACNPYLAFALVLKAGMEGITGRYESFDRKDGALPAGLDGALNAFDCEFVRAALPESLFKAYIKLKRAEIKEWEKDGEGRRCFETL